MLDRKRRRKEIARWWAREALSACVEEAIVEEGGEVTEALLSAVVPAEAVDSPDPLGYCKSLYSAQACPLRKSLAVPAYWRTKKSERPYRPRLALPLPMRFVECVEGPWHFNPSILEAYFASFRIVEVDGQVGEVWPSFDGTPAFLCRYQIGVVLDNGSVLSDGLGWILDISFLAKLAVKHAALAFLKKILSVSFKGEGCEDELREATAEDVALITASKDENTLDGAQQTGKMKNQRKKQCESSELFEF